MKIRLMAQGQEYEVDQVGVFSPEAGCGRFARRRRGRVHLRRHQDGQRRADRRHHHRSGAADVRSVPRLQGQQADGLRRPLSGGRQRVPAAARRAREAAAQRCVVLLRAGNLGGARLRVPLRLPRAAAHGDRPGAARARVRHGPGHDRAGRALPGDHDRRSGAGNRQPLEAARYRPDRAHRRAGDHRDDADPVRARRRHPAALSGEARRPEVDRVSRGGSRAGDLRAAVQRGRDGFLRPAEDDLARLRLARLPCHRLPGIAARQAGYPGQRGAGRRPVGHRPSRHGLPARPRARRRRCAS